MDYGLFRRFDKIGSTQTLPRTSLENGLFLVELRFSPQEETRSIPLSIVVDRTNFGEIARLTVSDISSAVPETALLDLREILEKTDPPVRMALDSTHNRLELVFIDQPGKSPKTYPGAFIFNSQDQLCVLVVRLHT